MKYKSWIKLFLSIVICQLAGILGSVFTTPQIATWYNFLKKPSFSPPNWVFGPVWTILFLLMGVSLWLVWDKKAKPKVIIVFAVQLALNILWSFLFFALHSPAAAFFGLIALWVAILFTIITFYKVSKQAAWLLIPYILWVSFAGFLNLFIWLLNHA